MNVIRHDAVSVNEKFASGGMESDAVDEPARDARVRPERAAIVKTERDEVEPPPTVVSLRKANVFALEIGHERPAQNRKHAALKTAALHLNLHASHLGVVRQSREPAQGGKLRTRGYVGKKSDREMSTAKMPRCPLVPQGKKVADTKTSSEDAGLPGPNHRDAQFAKGPGATFKP